MAKGGVVMQVTVGRIVHYVLSALDADTINRRRVPGVGHSEGWPEGAQAHVGNPAYAGGIVPAIVVWPHNNAVQSFNGQAFLDGNDVLWITSVYYDESEQHGTWHWPPQVTA